MAYETTLVYTERVLRDAAHAFWRRSLGIGFVIALVVVALGLVMLVAQGNTSWFAGALAMVLFTAMSFAVALYFTHYRQALSKLRRMGDSRAVFLADDSSFTFTSNLGTASLPWTAVKALWQFDTVWLLLYSKAQFNTLPLDCVSEELRSFVAERVRLAGGRVAA